MHIEYTALFILILLPIFLNDIYIYIRRNEVSRKIKNLSVKSKQAIGPHELDEIEASLNKYKSILLDVEYQIGKYKIKKMRLNLE